MIVYHLTPKRSAAAVQWQGLRIAHAIGVPRVWFYTACCRSWARKHIAKHKHCDESDLVEFAFNVPRGWLHRWRRGVWLCYNDVPALRMVYGGRVRDFLDDYVGEAF